MLSGGRSIWGRHYSLDDGRCATVNVPRTAQVVSPTAGAQQERSKFGVASRACSRRVSCVASSASSDSEEAPGGRSSPSTVRTNTLATDKCRSKLCRNCVRWGSKPRRTPTFTASHQAAWTGRNLLNRLPEEVFRSCSMSVAGIVFQACLIDRSSISPYFKSTTCGRCGFRRRRLVISPQQLTPRPTSRSV